MSGEDLAAIAANLSSRTTPSRTSAAQKGPRTAPPPARGTEAAVATPPEQPIQTSDQQQGSPTDDVVDEPGTDLVPADEPKEVVRPAPTRRQAAPSVASSGVAVAAAGLAPPPGAGDLLQVRTQPPSTGEWVNQLMNTGQYALNCRRGDIVGAVLLIAMQHSEDIVALLEAWRGKPDDTIKSMVWEAWKQQERQRQESIVQVVDEG